MLFTSQIPDMSLWSSAIIASLIVLFGWGIAVYFIVRYVNRKVNKITDQVYEKIGDFRYLFYGVSVLFWPAALVLGIYFLNNGRDARVGRICIFILLGTFTICFLVTIALVIAGVVYFPEIFHFFIH